MFTIGIWPQRKKWYKTNNDCRYWELFIFEDKSFSRQRVW